MAALVEESVGQFRQWVDLNVPSGFGFKLLLPQNWEHTIYLTDPSLGIYISKNGIGSLELNEK